MAKCKKAARSRCCQSAAWLGVVTVDRHEMVQGAVCRLPEDYNVDATSHAARRTLQPEITRQNVFIIGPELCHISEVTG